MNEYPPQYNQPPQEPQQPNEPWRPSQHTSYPPQQPYPPQPGWGPAPQYPPPPMYPQPGQYPYQQPPMHQPGPAAQPPQKPSFLKRKVGCLPMWALILILIVIFYGIGSAATHSATNTPITQATNTVTATTQPTDTPAPTATPAPTQAPATWKTTHSFTGSGIKKTAIFTAPDDWKITWSCDPSSFYGSQYNVQVYVYSSDSTPTDVAINEICKNGNTSGETEEHQGGGVYLDINSEGSWKVQVQELQ
ncbi:MAG TPA: hypothetical protein VF026_23850 [Ktedonobacteraceae bacterium]